VVTYLAHNFPFPPFKTQCDRPDESGESSHPQAARAEVRAVGSITVRSSFVHVLATYVLGGFIAGLVMAVILVILAPSTLTLVVVVYFPLIGALICVPIGVLLGLLSAATAWAMRRRAPWERTFSLVLINLILSPTLVAALLRFDKYDHSLFSLDSVTLVLAGMVGLAAGCSGSTARSWAKQTG